MSAPNYVDRKDVCKQNLPDQTALRDFCRYINDQQRYPASDKRNINEPVHEISNNVVCVTSKASDQPAHLETFLGRDQFCGGKVNNFK